MPEATDSVKDIGNLQIQILKTIAFSNEKLTVNQIATLLGKAQTTVFSSVNLLIIRSHLTFDQEYARGRKWLKLTDFGAFVAIATFSEVPYTTVYKNHPYLKMPEILQELAGCTIDDRSKSELISGFALKLVAFGPYNLFPSGHVDLSYNSRYSHHLGALLLDTIQEFLSKDENPQLINYDKVRVLLDRAKEMYDNSFERIAAKICNYNAVIKGRQEPSTMSKKEMEEAIYKFGNDPEFREVVMQNMEIQKKRHVDIEPFDSYEAFKHLMETLRKNDPQLYTDFMNEIKKESEARAMKSKAPARKRQP